MEVTSVLIDAEGGGDIRDDVIAATLDPCNLQQADSQETSSVTFPGTRVNQYQCLANT